LPTFELILTWLQVVPNFDKLQSRRVYVHGNDSSLLKKYLPRVWLRTIVQPKDSHFEVAQGSDGWNTDQRCFVALHKSMQGQLIFRDRESGAAFKIAINLEELGLYDSNDAAENLLRYSTWCKLIDPLLAGDPGFVDFEGYWSEIEDESLLNTKFIKAIVLSGRVHVEAKLGVEEFLGRK